MLILKANKSLTILESEAAARDHRDKENHELPELKDIEPLQQQSALKL